ncbi:AT hook containing transcription factor 1 homolog isoform X2 [Tachypleus tridentatus]|uniref:AT hook containing transcription factor 1 homolog isoform X2 n=1 Tax=Tachypleus tridentatus TaxID=6853 RepID=UPI003FCFCC95
MRREIIPDMVSDFLTFPASPFENWGRSHGILASDSPNTSPYFGQISQDGAWIWETRGPLLEVFSTSRCERCSSWCFGAILKDTSVVISAVTELPSSGNSAPKLLVGVEYASSGNLLCLFDIKTSKVVKAVEVNAKITSLAVISSKGGVCMETRPIYQELRCMFGLVAVGTLGGQVLLLDLNLDDENHSDELTPNQAVMITQQMHNIPERREKNIKHNKHLCLLLNEICMWNRFKKKIHTDDSFQRGAFLYKSEDNSPIHNFIVDDALYVSSIEYLKPLTALVVGFSFGGFQIWNMRKMALEFSSFLESGLSPVVKVAFQEPENDPRNYCYLWIVHGQPVFEKQRPQKVAVASMFSVTYRNKDWLDGYGCLYQDFQTCSLRFQCPLTLDPYYSDLGHSPENKNNTSRLVSCQTIQQSNIWGPERHEREDSLQNSDWDDIQELSLCVLVWEAWFDVADTNSHCIMLIFDINQWYQAQMPSSFRISSGKFSSYVEIFSLTKVLEEADRGSFLLDVHIVPSSLMKFNSKSSVEQFYFPSSLGFKLYCVTENGIMQLSFLGIQRQILSKMVTNGPSILVNPQSLYSMCLKAGLVSHHQELDDVSISAQREAVLSVALEYNLSHFFAACINQWASSDDHSGCTLRFLCNWAWKKVTQIKTSSDRLLPFFNCSGQEVDKATLNLLQSYSNQLNHLACLIHLLQSQCGSITQQGQVELELRCEVTEIVALYLKVTLWMFTCRLLPEHSEGTAYGENEVAYPVKIFTDTYTRRRQELQKLHSTVNHIDILLVDGLVLEIESFLDQHLWQREGGNGQYPPPSLYAALSSYLLKGVPVDKKHCLILYLLLDMAAFLSERQSHLVEHLMKFSATFHVNPSLVKLTQGFWLLDHRDFEEALSALLDPVIDLSDFKSWHHLRILKAFLYQGEHQKALKYTRVRNPPHETPEEVKLCLTILLANKLTAEAFHFQRQCRDQKNMDDFLSHFFLGCQQTLVLDSLLQLPLSVAEEEALVQFLYNSNDPKTKEMLVMYFLQRCRPLQAAQLNEKVYPHLMESDSFSHKEKSKARNALVQGYLSSLPEAQNRLASEFSLHQHQRLNKRQEVLRPFPLSTVVSTKLLPVVSHSTLFESLMKKVTEADLCGFQEPITPFRKSSREKINLVVDDVPFVCTPLTPRKSRTNRMSEIIYPTSVSKDTLKRSADHYDTQGSPKKSRLVEMSPFKLTYLDRRKSIKHLGSEVLSLLQTPPISRKPVSPKDQILASTGSTPAITPSSILKVRQLLHKTGSSPAIGNDDQDEEKGVTEECDAEDMEVVRPIPDDEEEEEDVSRHLRFMVPKARSLTPPYQECWPSTPPPRLSPRTLRDRSPTPERPSTPPPRWSPRTLRDRSPTPERPSTPPPRLSPRYVRDRSSTPDRSSLKDYRASPRRPLRQTSIISPYSEAYSPCADLLVEDEDITLNFSVQKKREVSHIDKKGMLSSRSPLEKPSTSSVCRRTPCVANEHLIGQALLSPSHETSHQFITTEDIIETKALSTIHEVTESTSIHKTSLEEHSAQIEANFIPIEVTESVDLLTDKNLSIENTLTSHKAIHQASSIEKVETFKSEQSFSEKSPIYFRSVKGDKSSFTKTPDQTPESVLDSVQKAEVLVTPPKTSVEEQKVTVEPSNTSVDSGESERFLTSANTPLKIVRNLLGSSLTSVETPLKVGFSSTPTEMLVQERKDVLRFSETTVETPIKVGFSVIPSEILVQEGKGLSGPSVTDANTFSETSDTSEKLNYSEAPTEVPCPGKKYLMEPSYVFTGMQEEITADEMKVSLEPFFVTKEIPDHEKKLSLESSGTIWETPEETPDYEMKVSLKSSVTTREISDNEKKISQGSSGTIREIPVETPDKETKLSLEFTSTVRETPEESPDYEMKVSPEPSGSTGETPGYEMKVLLDSSGITRETPEESPDYEMKVSPEPSGSTGETPGYEMKVLLDSSGITRETPEESPDYKKKVSPEPSGSTGETPGYEMKVLLDSSGITRETPEESPDYKKKVSPEPSGSTGETPGYEMKVLLESSGTTRDTPEELPDGEMKVSLEPSGTIRETSGYEMKVSLEPSGSTGRHLVMK